VSDLATSRLKLRQWRDADLAPFAALNADPEVMRYFPATMTQAQSDEFAGYVYDTIERQGWGLWAVEVSDGAPFIGFVGLNRVSFDAHFTPAVEVGWRLARPFWGNGYATEAGEAALTFGFEELHLEEILSFTSPLNEPSIAVMRRLGRRKDAGGVFYPPWGLVGSPLRRHVLYRLAKHAS
jgi:RimJ/RimL family protein N-acetyltransferase